MPRVWQRRTARQPILSAPPREANSLLLVQLPPSFWEPYERRPTPDTPPPTQQPVALTLESLAFRADGHGENFSDDSLRAIIIKAQPRHSNQSLSHLTRAQLVKHVDDLVAWWKQANGPERSTPSLNNLALRDDIHTENFSDDSLRAIIIKAQPHHSNQSLSHLTRAQLIKHVDDLVAWWKQANP